MNRPNLALSLAELVLQGIPLRVHRCRIMIPKEAEIPETLRARLSRLREPLAVILHTAKQLRAIAYPTPRDEAHALLRAARLAEATGLARAMRFAWRERLAICTVDGHLSENEAEDIAAGELSVMVLNWTEGT